MKNPEAKIHEIKLHCIERLSEGNQYPGYPSERFIGNLSEFQENTIPNGPWSTDSYAEVRIDPETVARHSLITDMVGRPLHPWASEMAVSNGVVTGKGEYWNWGPNYTVDPVVISDTKDPHILLIQRKSGKWAFPGGFLDKGETILSAHFRECMEETGVELEGNPLRTIYIGPVADERTTAHAWAHTDARLWRPTEMQPVRVQEEEVLDVLWIPVDKLPANLHGSHAKIIEFALREI